MSTIIIRLQNLPLSAKAADIREFFGDLKIPKGSVNIVGGPSGDAFIGFQTDEDARLAMLLDGRLLHKAKIRLMLSSRREMEQVIANAQALAGAAKQASATNHQQELPSSQTEPKVDGVSKQPELKDDGLWKTQMEAAPIAVVPPAFPFGSTPPQSVVPVRDFPQSFGSDSWKIPQQNLPSQPTSQPAQAGQQIQHTQLPFQVPVSGISQQQQPSPVFPGSAQAPFGGVPTSASLNAPSNQPHYQQLVPQQPPGFPPPLNLPPQTQQPQQQRTRLPPPHFPSFTGNGFFNQQPSPVGSRLPPSSSLSQNFGQQQHFGAVSGGVQPSFGHQGPGAHHRPFRPHQPFGRPGHTENQQPRGAQHGQAGFRPLGPAGATAHRPQHYRQRFEGGGIDGGGKRHRSRSPPSETGKRPFPPSRGEGNGSASSFPASLTPSTEPSEKDRVCVQLLNVPYKATFMDLREYLAATKADCVKMTRVYQQDRNYSDRWIVEFDNDKDARTVIKHRGEINNRLIRAEQISSRKADDLYAVPGPDEKNDSGSNKRSDETRRDREPRERDRRDRERARERGSDRSRSPGRSRNRDRDRSRHGSRGRTETVTTTVWAKEEKKAADLSRKEKASDGAKVEEKKEPAQTNQNQPSQQHPPPPTISHSGPLNFITNAAAFGAFSFPDNQNNAVYRPKTGGTVQIGGRHGSDGPIPLRAFEPFSHASNIPQQRFPIPLNHLGGPAVGGIHGQQKGPSPPNIQQQQQQQSSSVSGQIPPLRSMSNNLWSIPANSQVLPPLQSVQLPRPINPSTNVSSVKMPTIQNTVPPAVNASTSQLFNASLGSLDTSVASGLVIQEDHSMDEAESDSDVRVPPHSSKSELVAKSGPFTTLNRVPDQPPLDLLEPEHDSTFISPQQSLSKSERCSFDSTPNREFTAQELELRPHLSFLIRYKEDPNANSCIRLENIPKMVYADQLADFLGVQLSVPCENIARMQNGVLYINLMTEAMATKAMLKNTHFLNGNQITITQLKRAEMADAIRQNMIIIREMYRVSVVARGFPLITQPKEVISLFERFNLNKDGVEKCAIQPKDKVSTFLLTFASTQDCQNAIQALNNTETPNGAHIQVFQPTGN